MDIRERLKFTFDVMVFGTVTTNILSIDINEEEIALFTGAARMLLLCSSSTTCRAIGIVVWNGLKNCYLKTLWSSMYFSKKNENIRISTVEET